MFNLVVLTGRLTADPELRKTTSGLSVTSFTVAVERNYKSGEERQADFINVVAWRGTADFVSTYFKKGQMIAVTGSVSMRVYSSAVDKCMKAGLTINVQRIELLGGKSDDIPAKLYTESEGKEVMIMKYFFAPTLQREVTDPETVVLDSKRGEKYKVDRQGWVSREKPAEG